MSYKPVLLHEAVPAPSLSLQPPLVQSSPPSQEVLLNVIFLSTLTLPSSLLLSLSHLMGITDSFGLLCPILADDQSTIWSFGVYSKPYQQPFTTRKI